MNLIIQFPVFVQPYTQKRLVMYQIETVLVPILDENEQVHSYTELKIEKLYIVLNEETYITLCSQELKMCKKNIESITPPSLKNLSIEEENSKIEHKATSWEANVAQNLDLLPRSSSPYPKKKTYTPGDLETDTDDNMVDMTDFFDSPQNEKRSPRPKQAKTNSEQCPTPQNSPTHTPKSSVSTTTPAKPHRNKVWGILPDKRRVPH